MPESRGRRLARAALATWRAVNFEQKVAAIGALLLIVSTLGPFSFVEAGELLVAVSVLALVRLRGEGRTFRLPVADGTALMAAGVWAALLIAVRLFDRPPGQNLLALACAAIIVVAGAAERAKHPPPPEPEAEPQPPAPSEPGPAPSTAEAGRGPGPT